MFTTIISDIAAKHQFTEECVTAVFAALYRTGGQAAVFVHPEFGGMVRWTNGMMMSGGIASIVLQARVYDLCSDIARYVQIFRNGELLLTSSY